MKYFLEYNDNKKHHKCLSYNGKQYFLKVAIPEKLLQLLTKVKSMWDIKDFKGQML